MKKIFVIIILLLLLITMTACEQPDDKLKLKQDCFKTCIDSGMSYDGLVWQSGYYECRCTRMVS